MRPVLCMHVRKRNRFHETSMHKEIAASLLQSPQPTPPTPMPPSTTYDAQRTRRALMQFEDNAGLGQPALKRRFIWAYIVHLKNQWIL